MMSRLERYQNHADRLALLSEKPRHLAAAELPFFY
jgi:hypothetical protein